MWHTLVPYNILIQTIMPIINNENYEYNKTNCDLSA